MVKKLVVLDSGEMQYIGEVVFETADSIELQTDKLGLMRIFKKHIILIRDFLER